MNPKQLLFTVFLFYLVYANCQLSYDSLTCIGDTATFALNKFWEFDDYYNTIIADTLVLENKKFFVITSDNNENSIRYYCEEKDGNIYSLSKDKKKCYIFIPKEEIPDFLTNVNGFKYVIKSYHASVRAPYCIYNDLIMLEGLRIKSFWKRGIGEVIIESKGKKKFI